MTVEVDAVLDGRYALEELIAQGGMADVYRGTDRLLQRAVAVKVLREFTEDTQRDRFIAEARTLASLNHPGLVTLLDAGITIDRPYLVLELASGPTLSACIAEGRMDSARAASIGRQLAEALAYAHAQGVVHRDVKPSNVLVCDQDRVLLADFGIAQLVGAAEHHTKSGETIGSPAYLAPEQVAAEPVTPAADVFSLGLTLLEAMTGVRAYVGTPIEAAVARLHAAPIIPSYLDPPWRALIARMTHRDPSERPAAAEVASELRTAFDTSAPAGSRDARLGAGVGTGAAPTGFDPGVRTGPLELTADVPVVPSPPDEEARDDDEVPELAFDVPRHRVRTAAVIGLVVLAALIGSLALGLRNGEARTDPDPAVPSGVPTRLQEPLKNLHTAIEGHHG